MKPDLEQIQLAQKRFKGIIPSSPLMRSPYLSQRLGSEIFLKLENLQETGSFKVRGAYNRLFQLGPEEK
ncbi:MAG: pyridoxal-phosphate dependent enzyme, partial [Desulfobacteraceae bacterium]